MKISLLAVRKRILTFKFHDLAGIDVPTGVDPNWNAAVLQASVASTYTERDFCSSPLGEGTTDKIQSEIDHLEHLWFFRPKINQLV